VSDEFRSWRPPEPAPSFEALYGSLRFDDVETPGRRGAVLVHADASGIPIVRSTTPYTAAARPFQLIHEQLAQRISQSGLLPPFNHVLAEHYSNAYSKMKRHSDQAQDLAEGSWIAVYSCYRDPERASRRLVVHPKEAGAGFEIPLEHAHVVAFSLDTNRRFTHAIKLRVPAPDNEWLGLTFRTSKTRVRFVDGRPTLANGTCLTLATEEQRRELFSLRRRENEETSFTYPELSYTLSQSDLLPPAP